MRRVNKIYSTVIEIYNCSGRDEEQRKAEGGIEGSEEDRERVQVGARRGRRRPRAAVGRGARPARPRRARAARRAGRGRARAPLQGCAYTGSGTTIPFYEYCIKSMVELNCCVLISVLK